MVDNIILDTLTGPALQKGVSPLISTKDGERDGSRGVGGGGEFYNISNLTYLGAFRVVSTTGQTTKFNTGAAIGHRPATGTNGSFGSIYFGNNTGAEATTFAMAEAIIPETLNPSLTDYSSLPVAELISDYIDIGSSLAGSSVNGHGVLGCPRVIDGRLFMNAYNYYDSNGNPSPLCMFENPDNILTSPTSGWLPLSDNNDYGSVHMNPIPPEYQSALGGTWMLGSGKNTSRSQRWSMGPSIVSFNPSDINSATTSFPHTFNLYFPYRDELDRDMAVPYHRGDIGNIYETENTKLDRYNERVTRYYLEQLGYDYTGGGIGTYVDSGGATQLAPQALIEYIINDNSTPEFSTIPEPSDGLIRNDIFNFLIRIGTSFIIPNTKTFACFGSFRGRKFGGGYKLPYVGLGGERSGGDTSIDKKDVDQYYWLFNIEDVINSVNPWDPMPYEYGVFDSNKWVKIYGDQASGGIEGGFFDAENSRLYLAHPGHTTGLISNTIVSVYQV